MATSTLKAFRLFSTLLLCWLTSLPCARAAENAGTLLHRALEQHADGRFEASVQTLLRAEKAATDAKLRAKIWLYLGVNRVVLNENQAARQAFGKALREDPSLDLDPDRFKSNVIRVFNEVKASLNPRAAGYSSPPPPPLPVEKPKPGRLTVHTAPAGAEVLVDGKLMGHSPLDKTPVAAGEHRVLVRLDGRHDETRMVRLEPDGEANLELELRVRPPLLPPGTRRWYVNIGLGGAIRVAGSAHVETTSGGEAEISFPSQFTAVEEVGFHFAPRSSGPGLSLVLAESMGAFDYAGVVSWSAFVIQPGVRFFWDIQLGNHAFYLSPSLQVGYAYMHVGSCEGCGYSTDPQSAQAVVAQPALDLKLIFADRVLLYLRPVSIEVLSFFSTSLLPDTTLDTVAIRYGLQLGGGFTF